jgi:hypothetical protein
MGPQLIAVVERLTDRAVRGFLSGSDESGAAAVELFLLETDPDIGTSRAKSAR